MIEEEHHVCHQERFLGELDERTKSVKEDVDKREQDIAYIRRCITEMKQQQDRKPSWAVTTVISILCTITAALIVYILTAMSDAGELEMVDFLGGLTSLL